MCQSLHLSLGHKANRLKFKFEPLKCTDLRKKALQPHWKYKTNSGLDEKTISASFGCGHLVEWQQEMQDPSDFLNTLKIDLYPEEVYASHAQGQSNHSAAGCLPLLTSRMPFILKSGNTCVGAKG
jgi:GTP pyrophosphokinase